MSRTPILRPELSLELHLAAGQQCSSIKISDTNDAVVVLDSIKELTHDHLAVIYIDGDDNVIEVDTFLCGLNEFSTEQTNRALASVLYNQNSGIHFRLIIAQTVYGNPEQLVDRINTKTLANFAARMLLMGVELIDCILIADTGYLSLKDHGEKWTEFTDELRQRKDIIGDGSFFPDILGSSSQHANG